MKKQKKLVTTQKEMEAYERHISATSEVLSMKQLNEMKMIVGMRSGNQYGCR